MSETRQLVEELARRNLLGLAERCARECNVTILDVFSRDRTAAVSRARALFCACLYARGQWSYSEIGRLIGRDHGAVMHLVGNVDASDVQKMDTVATTHGATSWSEAVMCMRLL